MSATTAAATTSSTACLSPFSATSKVKEASENAYDKQVRRRVQDVIACGHACAKVFPSDADGKSVSDESMSMSNRPYCPQCQYVDAVFCAIQYDLVLGDALWVTRVLYRHKHDLEPSFRMQFGDKHRDTDSDELPPYLSVRFGAVAVSVSDVSSSAVRARRRHGDELLFVEPVPVSRASKSASLNRHAGEKRKAGTAGEQLSKQQTKKKGVRFSRAPALVHTFKRWLVPAAKRAAIAVSE